MALVREVRPGATRAPIAGSYPERSK
jgi:hypothetical protein